MGLGVAASRSGDPIRANSRKLRNPDFFDYARYIEDLDLPIDLDARGLVAAMQALAAELNERGLTQDPEHRYKLGTLLHWMEALLAACEMWKAAEEPEFLNAVVMQYNAFVNQFNQVISESALKNALPRADAAAAAAHGGKAARIPAAPLPSGPAIRLPS